MRSDGRHEISASPPSIRPTLWQTTTSGPSRSAISPPANATRQKGLKDLADTLQSDAKHEWLAAVIGVDLRRGAASGQAPAANAGAAPAGGAAAPDAPGDGAALEPSGGSAAAEAPGGAPAQLPPAMDPAGMKDEDIAAAIMDKQLAILIGWEGALAIFDKTMTSNADAEATPDFQKAVTGYFAGKLMNAMMSAAPGGAEIQALTSALQGDYQRAAAAGASAKLRDFVNEHTKAITRLQQATLAQRQGFISAVRARREAAEAPAPKSGKKGGKWGTAEPTAADNDYAVMRLVLMDMLASIDRVLGVSTTESLFRVLSEEWIRHATVRGGMGTRFSAVVVIRLNPNYSILDAHIQGAGGQKLAEQLLKDAPDGVDVFHLQAPRRILLMADNGWPSAILSLDANNRDASTGSIAEGDTGSLYKYVMSKGLPLTKKLTGD
jgi:hypothetical protein